MKDLIGKKIGFSNIALIKYWGKKNNLQIPVSPSISFTLKKAMTTMEYSLSYKKNDFGKSKILLEEFLFEGTVNLQFQKKIQSKIQKILDYYPTLLSDSVSDNFNLNLSLKSWNSFPHSAGIASSASSMSALAQILNLILKVPFDFSEKQNESFLARELSGSAARSVYPGFVSWGEIDGEKSASDLWASPLDSIHPTFKDLQDWILIVDKIPKKVNSSLGHERFNDHPYLAARIKNAHKKYDQLRELLNHPMNFEFFKLIEGEALELHALMWTSVPSFNLLSPSSLKLIHYINEIREQFNIFCGYTIDAGPNIHLIFPKSEEVLMAKYFSSSILEGVLGHQCEVFCDEINWDLLP